MSYKECFDFGRFFCVTKLKRKDQLILALFFAKRQKVVSKTGKKTGDIEG